MHDKPGRKSTVRFLFASDHTVSLREHNHKVIEIQRAVRACLIHLGFPFKSGSGPSMTEKRVSTGLNKRLGKT